MYKLFYNILKLNDDYFKRGVLMGLYHDYQKYIHDTTEDFQERMYISREVSKILLI